MQRFNNVTSKPRNANPRVELCARMSHERFRLAAYGYRDIGQAEGSAAGSSQVIRECLLKLILSVNTQRFHQIWSCSAMLLSDELLRQQLFRTSDNVIMSENGK